MNHPAMSDVRRKGHHRSGSEIAHFRGEAANAICAILLHAEAVHRLAAGGMNETNDMTQSCEGIVCNARRAWQAMETLLVLCERVDADTPEAARPANGCPQDGVRPSA